MAKIQGMTNVLVTISIFKRTHSILSAVIEDKAILIINMMSSSGFIWIYGMTEGIAIDGAVKF